MDYSLNEKNELIGKEGQKDLLHKTVSIVGLGGIGSTVAQILARNGLQLRIIDKDRIYEKDVCRQTLFRAEDISKFKAKQAKKHLEEINKDIKIKSFHEELTEDNIFLLEADAIIDVSNDMKTSLLINAFALKKGIPVIFSNYVGERGFMFIVDKEQFPKGPCIECLQEKLQLPAISEEGVFAPITTMLASLVATATLKNIMNYENIGTLQQVDVFRTEIRHTKIEKHKQCSSC